MKMKMTGWFRASLGLKELSSVVTEVLIRRSPWFIAAKARGIAELIGRRVASCARNEGSVWQRQLNWVCCVRRPELAGLLGGVAISPKEQMLAAADWGSLIGAALRFPFWSDDVIEAPALTAFASFFRLRCDRFTAMTLD